MEYNGKPCRKCGSTLRYVSNNNCIACKHRYDASPECAEKYAVRKQSAKYKLYHQNYRQSENGVLSKKRWRLKSYGLTLEAFNHLLSTQKNQCAICETEFSHTENAHIDHDHKTRNTRGLLCGPCNRAIGLLKDDPRRCNNAAEYLYKYATRRSHQEKDRQSASIS